MKAEQEARLSAERMKDINKQREREKKDKENLSK
jgi:hypothetical protein